MKILDIKKIEDCLDGSIIKEILLEKQICLKFIKYMGEYGKLQYFPNFSRPFFKIQTNDYMLKGIEGNKSIRIIITEKKSLEKIKTLIQNFNI